MECPKCGREVESAQAGGACPHCGPAAPPDRGGSDWPISAPPGPSAAAPTAQEAAAALDEAPPRIGPGWVLSSWINCLVRPGKFFSGIQLPPNYGRPIIFSIGMDVIAASLMVLLSMAGISGYAPARLIVVLPLASLLVSLLLTGAFHAALAVLRGASGGFAGTFAVIFYSCASHIWIALPKPGKFGALVGALVIIWRLVIIVAGLKTVHRTTWARSVLAVVLIPLLVLGALLLRWIVIARL
jgi:hypothetical protein